MKLFSEENSNYSDAAQKGVSLQRNDITLCFASEVLCFRKVPRTFRAMQRVLDHYENSNGVSNGCAYLVKY